MPILDRKRLMRSRGGRTFLKLLFYIRLYRVFLICFTLILAFSGLVVSTTLKLIRVNPGHVEEVIRISLLDMAHAHQMRSAAVKASEGGDINRAQIAWQTCLANNPCNLRNLREYLFFVEKFDEFLEFGQSAMNMGLWLLRLSEDSNEDLELVARCHSKYGLDAKALELLDRQRGEPANSSKMLQARIILKLGRQDEYPAIIPVMDDVGGEDSERSWLDVCWKYLSASDTESHESARDLIMAHLVAPDCGRADYDFIFSLASHRKDKDLMRQTIGRYQLHEFRVFRQYNDWLNVLLDLGDYEEVRAMTASSESLPETSDEFLSRFRLLNRMGDEEAVSVFTEKCLRKLGDDFQVWQGLLNHYENRADWRNLRKYADRMLEDGRTMTYQAFSKLLACTACLNLGDFKSAELYVNQISLFDLKELAEPEVILERTIKMGFFEHSKGLLEKLLKIRKFRDSVALWTQALEAGKAGRDFEFSSVASRRLYELQPDNEVVRFNHSAFLMMAGRDLELAKKLAGEFSENHPEWVPGLINYAQVLVKTGDLIGADTILNVQMQGDRLVGEARSEYYVAVFELENRRKNYAKAIAAYKEIDFTGMFVAQREELENQYHQAVLSL